MEGRPPESSSAAPQGPAGASERPPSKAPPQGGMDEEACAAWILSGARPPSEWRVGVEHERFLVDPDSRRPLPWEAEDGRSVSGLLAALAGGGGWRPERDAAGAAVALSRGRASLTLEPGGQIELSGAPLEDAHACADEMEAFRLETGAAAAAMGAVFLGLGAAPEWSLEEAPRVPKERYAIMRRYLPGRGARALDMMHRTCTVQANLDFSDERDWTAKMRVALGLQPAATALFANSPFLDGAPTGWASERMRIWEAVDPDRCAPPDVLFERGAGVGDYVRLARAAPMFFVRRGGRHLDAAGARFADFEAGRLEAAPGERAGPEDWDDHLSTLFPPARSKRWIETRGADGSCVGFPAALAAFWTGLLYDADALAEAEALACAMDDGERRAFREAAARGGLAGAVSLPAALVEGGGAAASAPAGRGGDGSPRVQATAGDAARRVLGLAEAGLARRARRRADGEDERVHLAPLRAALERGASQAERRLALWRGEWGRDFARLLDDASC